MKSQEIREGLRIFRRNCLVKIKGMKKFSGSDEKICREIILGCFDKEKKYFKTSMGNYPVFYCRDFGWCTQALLNLGFSYEVNSTLKYAIEIFEENKDITVAINPKGYPFNFPNTYSPDSVAYFFRSLRLAKAKDLILKHKDFLNSQIVLFERIVLEDSGEYFGLVKNRNFSGMRDYEIVNRSCYDMIMACMLADEIVEINKLFRKKILKEMRKDLKKNLIKYYWNKDKEYFNSSIDDKSMTGHCNVYPYWLDIIVDRKMLKKSLESIRMSGLANPLPLAYANSSGKNKFIWQEMFVPNWEHDMIWSMLGMAYIEILFRIDKKSAKEELMKYKSLIEKYGFVELYTRKLKPYTSLFYSTDNTMLWASMYLNLKKRKG